MARSKYYNHTTQRWEYADSNPLPTGQDGDILVNENGVWVVKPKWQMIYQPVEYIESTGTQYIDTGVKPSATTRVIADMQFSEIPGSNASFLNGSSQSENNALDIDIYGFIWGIDGVTGKSATMVADAYTWARYDYGYDTNRHIWDIQSGSQKIDNNELSTTNFTRKSSRTRPLFFGARNSNGNKNNSSASKYYSIKIYDGDTLIRDFIPAYNVFTGEIGCYEMVEHKFFTNAGTGTFLKGADI